MTMIFCFVLTIPPHIIYDHHDKMVATAIIAILPETLPAIIAPVSTQSCAESGDKNWTYVR